MSVNCVGSINVPHAGEHAAPPAVSVQSTPSFFGSFVTAAFTVTFAEPATIVANLFVMETVIPVCVAA